jgi:hypothetical protein
MLIKTKHLLTTLVVAGITAFATQASATTYVAGDLLLGFRATSGQGSTSNLLVNIGQADTVYRDAVANIASVVDIGTLLDATYGTNWETRADLFWGVVGVRSNASSGAAVDGDPVRTLYATRAQSGTPEAGVSGNSTPWNVSGGTTRSTIANNITGVLGTYDAFSTAVTNTAVVSSTSGSTWSTQNGTNSFGFTGSVEGNFGNGTAGTVLDLYRILNSTSGASPTGTIGLGSWEGSFTINDSGVVGFAVTAVPEPSRALLAGLGLAGIAFRRRRTVKKTA